ncbi:unnamed protein product [Rotaria sp. Silwood2]|nr:unnamed protein product [Rotaria sp. Silwood2]
MESMKEKQKINRTIHILKKCLRDAAILLDESCEQINAYKEQVKEYLNNIYIEYLNFLIVLIDEENYSQMLCTNTTTKDKFIFIVQYIQSVFEKNDFIKSEDSTYVPDSKSILNHAWIGRYQYNHIDVQKEKTSLRNHITIIIDEHVKMVDEKLNLDKREKLDHSLNMLINGFKKDIINTSSGGNGNQLPSLSNTPPSPGEDMQPAQRQSLPPMYFGGPRDPPPPHMMHPESLPPPQPGQFVYDFYGAEPPSMMHGPPPPHHHPHMGNLLGPEPSPHAHGMMFMHGSSTQLMPRTYSPHTHHINNPQNPNSSSIVICGSCHKKVQDNEETVFCESGCKFFYHRTCVGLTEQALKMLNQENYAEWVCNKCFAEKHVPPVKFIS